MKFNTRIPRHLQWHFRQEVVLYKASFRKGDFVNAWTHLERAHIIGQAYPWPHSHAHWLMLKFGFAIKDYREIFGQIPRLLLGGIKSFVGRIPVGNTGGANVHPLRPMPIPSDIIELMNRTGE